MTNTYGIFTTIRVRNGNPFFLDDHLQRLQTDSIQINLEPPNEKNIKTDLDNLLKNKTRAPDMLLRIQIRPGDISYSQRIPVPFHKYPQIACVKTCLDLTSAKIKMIDRQHYESAMADAKLANADEAILVSIFGEIVDGCRTSPIIFDSEKFIEPFGGIQSITRLHFLRLCRSFGYATETRSCKVSELCEAESILLAGSGVGVRPTKPVNDMRLAKLLKIFEQQFF